MASSQRKIPWFLVHLACAQGDHGEFPHEFLTGSELGNTHVFGYLQDLDMFNHEKTSLPPESPELHKRDQLSQHEAF